MPLTFLSHQAVVLPLKLRAPRWFSGTALVLGSMAPDVEYFIRGMPSGELPSHTWLGQITLCLPTTLVLYWLVTRIIAEPLAAHLPNGGEFRLRDYALLRDQPSTLRHWGLVAVAAVIGSVSHVVLDRATGGWSNADYVQRRSWVPPGIVESDATWAGIQLGLWLVLAVATVLMLRHVGRRALLRRWAAERGAMSIVRPVGGSRLAAFWGPILVAGLAATAWGAAFRRPDYHLHEFSTWVQIGLRTVSCIFLVLVLVSAVWHVQRRGQSPPSRSPS